MKLVLRILMFASFIIAGAAALALIGICVIALGSK